MDLDLVLEITPEKLEEFPEVTETDLVTGVNEEGIIVPDCSQHSLQTSKDHTEDTPQKEEVHTRDTTLTTHPIGRDTPDRSTKDKGTQKTITGKPSVYETRSHVRPRRRKYWRWEKRQNRPQISSRRCNTTPTNADCTEYGCHARAGETNVQTKNKRNRRQRWRRLRSRILRQFQRRWDAQNERTLVLREAEEKNPKGNQEDQSPGVQGRTWRETRSPPIAHLGLVRCHWCAYRQGEAEELQTHSGFLSQRMVRRHMVQKNSRFQLGKTHE